MGLLSKDFEKEERDFIKQLDGKLSLEEIAHIRKRYEYNFNSEKENFNKFKKEVLKRIKPEH